MASRVQSMQEEQDRLQAQLQTGYDGFNSFKEKKAEETKELQAKMEAMSNQVVGSDITFTIDSGDRIAFFLLFSQLASYPTPEKLASVEAELSSCQAELSTASSEISALSSERDRLAGELEAANGNLRRSEAVAEEMGKKLDEATKVSGWVGGREKISPRSVHSPVVFTDSQQTEIVLA